MALIGEAPGKMEAIERLLDKLLESAGIKRNDCFITNVLDFNPPHDDFDALAYETYEEPILKKDGTPRKRGKKVTRETTYFVEQQERLKAELLNANPFVVVPLGEHALNAVSGLHGITSWRGSIIRTKPDFGSFKCVPTFHPSYIRRGNWDMWRVVVHDLKRALDETQTRELNLPARVLITKPDFATVLDTLGRYYLAKEPVAFDIETDTRTNNILCIGLSNSPDHAICIPISTPNSPSWWKEEEELEIWHKLRQLFHDRPTVAQNSQFDCAYLEKYGVVPGKLVLDTMLAHGTLFPGLPKSLEFQASILTREPYWKGPHGDLNELWEYNARDAAVTREIYAVLRDELERRDYVGFYHRFVHDFIPIVGAMGRAGVRVDVSSRDTLDSELRQVEEDAGRGATEAAGHEVNPLSTKQVGQVLFTEFGVSRPGIHGKSGQTSTAEAVLQAVLPKLEGRAQQFIMAVLKARETSKMRSTYVNCPIDDDGRVRPFYNICGAKTGRWSSSTNPFGTGTNMQNWPKGVRRLLLPDDGHVFYEVDLRQAEAMVVAWMCGDEAVIWAFRQGTDVHVMNASRIFGIPPEQVSKEQRYIAKRGVHAGNYGVGPVTLLREVLMDAIKLGVDIRFTLADSRRVLASYASANPRIKAYHIWVQDRLRKSSRLVTPLGRVYTLNGALGEELFKEGYAAIPQSTVADVTNLGLKRLDAEASSWQWRVALQVHDSVVLSVPREYKPDVIAEAIRRCMLMELTVEDITGKRRKLTIPCDISVGLNWGELKEVK